MKLRDISRNFAKNIPIPADIKKEFKHLNYDSCLHIRIYGEPFSDSRPRINMQTMGVGLKNMNEMKKVFTPLYESSELLQNLTILSPFHIKAVFYRKPTKSDIKFINKSNKAIKALFKSNKLGDMGIKDVDNMLKIHNDILFSNEYRITLDDAWNIGFVKPEKYLSEEDFTDVFVYYSSKPNAYYMYKIQCSQKYYKWLLSEKNMKMNKRSVKDQLKHLRITIKDELNGLKSNKDVRDVLKRSFEVLEEYPATLIKALANMEESKYTKMDAQFKVMTIVTKGNKIAESILNIGGKYI